MCETELESKYRNLASGKTVLESSLHLNLSEHLNSEIGLGTITDINSAKHWLKDSFLYRRIQKNPAHYALNKETSQSWAERVDDLVMHTIAHLRKNELVSASEDKDDTSVSSTEYGDIMSKVICPDLNVLNIS